MKRVAVIDDHQEVAPKAADWSALEGSAEVVFFSGPLPDADLLADFEIIVPMRERTRFDRRLLERLPHLELLVTTGPINAAIDLEAAAEAEIQVWGTRGFLPPATELTWALILACAKAIPRRDREIKAGEWVSAIGGDLFGARLGVIGLGYYGSEVARIGLAFGMDVVAWSENLTDDRCRAAGVAYAGKQELLESSDFVTLHLKLSDRTEGLIGAEELGRMRPGAFLINTSRGAIVDEPALVQALEAGTIAGAGLDVFATEPLPAAHPLRRLPNVVCTPHIGYVTERSIRTFFEDVVEGILCHLEGGVGRVVTGTAYREGHLYVPGAEPGS